MGVLRVTREAVAAMKSKGTDEGHIININRYVGIDDTKSARHQIYTKQTWTN